MLIEFSCENFLSIKEKVTLNFLAVKDKRNSNLDKFLIQFDKYQVLRSLAIYGANASGKSNILKAIAFCSFFVKNSHNFQQGQLIPFIPFKLNIESSLAPGCFDFIFVNDGIRYAYGFATNNREVIREYLYSYPNGRQKVIYERDCQQYTFKNDIKVQNDIKDRTKTNSLYLSTAALWNYEPVKGAFSWFNSRLQSLFSEDIPFSELIINTAMILKNNILLYNKLREILTYSDIGISDLAISEENITDTIGLTNKKLKIQTIHNDNNGNKIVFDIFEESFGTQKLFACLGPILKTLTEGGCFIVDELDAKLHPLLSCFLVELFQNPVTNPNNAQLLFNTHDTNLLNSKIMRRDQIWFTEKRKDSSTALYPLTDFSPRKEENLEIGYLQGRYGAIPFIVGESEL